MNSIDPQPPLSFSRILGYPFLTGIKEDLAFATTVLPEPFVTKVVREILSDAIHPDKQSFEREAILSWEAKPYHEAFKAGSLQTIRGRIRLSYHDLKSKKTIMAKAQEILSNHELGLVPRDEQPDPERRYAYLACLSQKRSVKEMFFGLQEIAQLARVEIGSISEEEIDEREDQALEALAKASLHYALARQIVLGLKLHVEAEGVEFSKDFLNYLERQEYQVELQGKGKKPA